MPKRKGPTRGRVQRRAQAPPAEPRHPQTPFERELTTKRRGEISELAFALAAARHGFGISRPYGDSERYDLILDPSHVAPVISHRDRKKGLVTPNRAGKTNFVIPNRTGRKRLVIPNRAEGPVRNLLSARPRLIRVQVKATTQLQYGLYRANAHRRINGKAVAYTLDEIDFFVAHVIPEDSWFIFPLSHILGSTAVTLSPKRRRKRHCNDPYREAWHYLHEPDGLEFA
jgi:hypothetical protein